MLKAHSHFLELPSLSTWNTSFLTLILFIFLFWPSLQLKKIIVQRDSLSPAFLRRKVFFLPHRCWVCLCDIMILLWLPLGQNIYLHNLTLKLSMWLSWLLAQWGISRYDGSRGLNMLEWLGLFSCPFVITMSRASSRYLLFLQPGSQNKLHGVGLSLTDSKESRPTRSTVWSRATQPNLA